MPPYTSEEVEWRCRRKESKRCY